MDTYKLNLGAINGVVTVNVNKKLIKNVHLKVYRDLSVVLSVPNNVPDEWVTELLQAKTSWINRQITKYKEASGYNCLLNIKSGTSVQCLGKDMRILKNPSLQDGVEVDEKTITINLKDISDDGKMNKLLSKWWRDCANEVYIREMNNFYEKVFKKYGISIPTITIRKMSTLWGSCNKAKNNITLNEYLLKADLRCIQYVILHELTHLLYTYHNTDFYNFLTIQMPDWQERKKQLDKEVAQRL